MEPKRGQGRAVGGDGAARAEGHELYAIPVHRAVESGFDLDRPEVPRPLAVAGMRAELLPLLPPGTAWPAGAEVATWEGGGGARLELRREAAGRCAYLRWAGPLVGAVGEAVRRIAACPGWAVYDPQTNRFLR